MSKHMYWLNKRDAEFVISAVERYDHVTQAEAERSADSGPDDPVFEITVVRHERTLNPDRIRAVEYPTLQSALSADARTPEDGRPIREDFSDFLN